MYRLGELILMLKKNPERKKNFMSWDLDAKLLTITFNKQSQMKQVIISVLQLLFFFCYNMVKNVYVYLIRLDQYILWVSN